MSRLHQYTRSWKPYDGLAESVITSGTFFLGDAAMITGSWITSSGTASNLTLQGYEGDAESGFRTALPAATAGAWAVIKALSAQGYFSCDTIPMWGRFLRAPSLSSSTLFVSVHVGP